MAIQRGLISLQKLRNLRSLFLLSPTSQATTMNSPATTTSMFYPIFCPKRVYPLNPFGQLWAARHYATYESVNLVLSDGKPKFEINEVEPSGERKYLSKKRLKLKRKREKLKKKKANKNNPGSIKPKGVMEKEKFPTAEGRIKYKLEKARMKEAILLEKLRKYEVAQMQGPTIKPEDITGEERYYLKKMAQKKANYVPIGKRGVFGGVILNMHLHWKKHETVKVICKPCIPGQINDYVRDISRLSGGTPIHVENGTVVFYRGKNYVQPEVMSPIDTLSKKKALEKSKYEQSLQTVRRFIGLAEKELELYYRHVALYGNPSCRNRDLVYGEDRDNMSSRAAKANEEETDINTMVSDTEFKNKFSESDCDDESGLELELGLETEEENNVKM